MNQIVVIFVPYGETFTGMKAGERPHPGSNDEFAKIRDHASAQPAKDAERLPLWRWFTFETRP